MKVVKLSPRPQPRHHHHVNVHVDAWWEALDMYARSPKKFMNVSDVKTSAKGWVFFSVTRHADQSERTPPRRVILSLVSRARVCFSLCIQPAGHCCTVSVSQTSCHLRAKKKKSGHVHETVRKAVCILSLLFSTSPLTCWHARG